MEAEIALLLRRNMDEVATRRASLMAQQQALPAQSEPYGELAREIDRLGREVVLYGSLLRGNPSNDDTIARLVQLIDGDDRLGLKGLRARSDDVDRRLSTIEDGIAHCRDDHMALVARQTLFFYLLLPLGLALLGLVIERIASWV